MASKLNSTLEKECFDLALEVNQLWLKSGKKQFIIESGKEENFLIELQDKDLLTAFNLCNSFIQKYQSKYSESYMIKRLQPRFREILKGLSGVTEYRKLPLCLFTIDKAKVIKMNEDYREKIQETTSKGDFIYIPKELVNRLLKLTISWIQIRITNNKTLAYKSLGLALLTGRRLFEEIMINASFEIESYHRSDYLLFLGQAKSKDEKSFLIPILGVSNKEAKLSLIEIQDYLKSKSWYSEDIDGVKLRSNFNQYLAPIIFNEIYSLFQEYDIALDSFDNHDLRKLYATIIHYNYQKETGKTVDFTSFVPQYLGHSMKISKSSNKIFDNPITSQSYHKFVIID